MILTEDVQKLTRHVRILTNIIRIMTSSVGILTSSVGILNSSSKILNARVMTVAEFRYWESQHSVFGKRLQRTSTVSFAASAVIQWRLSFSFPFIYFSACLLCCILCAGSDWSLSLSSDM